MRYATGGDFRRALERRLLTSSLQEHVPLARLRKFVAFDRLLARLLDAAPDAWVLKGGLALQLRMGQRARATKDMDIMWWQSTTNLHPVLVAAAALDVGDWFQFTVEDTETAPEPLPGGGRRFLVRALVDSRPFETFHVDVGTDDPMVEPTQLLKMPALLEFADIPPALVPCFPITQQMAEKIHAYTRPYVSGASSRVKDFVDILLLAELQSMSVGVARQAMEATFAARNTHPIPAELPAPPGSWTQPFRKMADETCLPWRELDDAMIAAQQFVDPMLKGIDAGTWNPLRWAWEPRE